MEVRSGHLHACERRSEEKKNEEPATVSIADRKPRLPSRNAAAAAEPQQQEQQQCDRRPQKPLRSLSNDDNWEAMAAVADGSGEMQQERRPRRAARRNRAANSREAEEGLSSSSFGVNVPNHQKDRLPQRPCRRDMSFEEDEQRRHYFPALDAQRRYNRRQLDIVSPEALHPSQKMMMMMNPHFVAGVRPVSLPDLNLCDEDHRTNSHANNQHTSRTNTAGIMSSFGYKPIDSSYSAIDSASAKKPGGSAGADQASMPTPYMPKSRAKAIFNKEARLHCPKSPVKSLRSSLGSDALLRNRSMEPDLFFEELGFGESTQAPEERACRNVASQKPSMSFKAPQGGADRPRRNGLDTSMDESAEGDESDVEPAVAFGYKNKKSHHSTPNLLSFSSEHDSTMDGSWSTTGSDVDVDILLLDNNAAAAAPSCDDIDSSSSSWAEEAGSGHTAQQVCSNDPAEESVPEQSGRHNRRTKKAGRRRRQSLYY